MIGPMTPLFSSPDFPPALGATKFIKWNKKENTRIVQTLVDGRLPQMPDMGNTKIDGYNITN